VSCINKSVCKICRRENVKLFLKGDRCFTDKCAFERRPYPPGQHGQSRLKFSEFALQLREKQKTKRYYGVSEKQFRRYVGMAEKAKEVTGLALLKNLEQRLDNVVSTLGFATSRRDAKQIVSHGHVLVNGKKVNVPSYSVSKGDVIEISTGSKEAARIMAAVQGAGKRTVPTWLEVDHGTLKGVVKDLPGREEITLPVEENMIVEYYSR
jgi:small subunit ribosomal protein S4